MLTDLQFINFKVQITKEIESLAWAITEVNKNKCTETIAKCMNKSYDELKGTNKNRLCFEKYPKINHKCESDGVQYPISSGIKIASHINKLKNNEKLLICATTQLDQRFRNLKKKFLQKIGRVFFGTKFGFFRAYPGQYSNQQYDPRDRQWYYQALTGPKNLLIVIQQSQVMTKLYQKVIKPALQNIIERLNFNDFTGIYIIRSQPRFLLFQKPVRATRKNKSAFINSLRALNFSFHEPSIKNYNQAFLQASEFLAKSKLDTHGSGCSSSPNIILYFSGSDTNNVTENQLVNIFNATKIKFFPFTFGEKNNNFELLRNVTCKTGGIFNHYDNITQNQSLKLQKFNNELFSYEKYLASNYKPQTPIWTSPYSDSRTGKYMITISLPVYEYQHLVRQKIGVVGIDVFLDELKNLNLDQKEIIKNLVKCPHQSSYSTVTECYLDNYLRSDSTKCSEDSSKCLLNKKERCQFKVETSIIVQDEDQYQKLNQSICCRQTKMGGGFIISVCFLIVITILASAYCIRKKMRKKKQKVHDS